MSEVRALIIGAPGTPYELGFFEVRYEGCLFTRNMLTQSQFTVIFPRGELLALEPAAISWTKLTTKDYPQSPPKVTAETTDGGNTRFNPNIYATGKVCL